MADGKTEAIEKPKSKVPIHKAINDFWKTSRMKVLITVPISEIPI